MKVMKVVVQYQSPEELFVLLFIRSVRSVSGLFVYPCLLSPLRLEVCQEKGVHVLLGRCGVPEQGTSP